MRQRYRDTDWKYETELFNEPAKYEPTCLVSSIGAKFKPATLYVFFKDMEQGKYKRRKIPVRDLSKSVQIESIAHALIKRHDILNEVPFKNLLSVLEKIQSQLGSQTSDIISKPNNTTTANTTKGLPPLPKALPPPPYASGIHESTRIDGSLNLNKLGDDALSKVKSDMNFEFEKNRIKPGDAAFEYDVQRSFGPPVENNDWDQESESIHSEPHSHSRAEREKIKPPQNLGDLETDASSSAKDEISNMDDEISALLDNDFMPKKSPKLSVHSVERDEESGKASSTAFWWMKNDAEDAAQGPKTEPFKTEPSLKEASASTTVVDAVTVKSLVAEATPIETSLAAKPIVLSSGMSATLKALEQTRSLLDGLALDTHSTDSSSSKLAPVSPPKSSTKLSDLPPISFERFENPRELLPHPVLSSKVVKEAKKDVVLDIDDLDIDAGFAKYDAEEDEADDDANDFLNAFLPHKTVEPLLPVAMPVDASKPSHTALSSIVIDAMADAKLSKPSIINTAVPTVVETFYTPIDEDFGDILNHSADESEEDLSFLKKSSPQIKHTSAGSESQPVLKKANSESRMESPKFESVGERPKGPTVSTIAAAPAISVPGKPSVPGDVVETAHESMPKDIAKPASVLGPLPSLGPLPTLAKLNPVPSNAADFHPSPSKKHFDDEDDISEDFDFDGSVSDLLGINKDSDSVKGKSDDEKSASLHSHVNVASLRDKIPGIVGATSSMNLMKPFVDDASDARSKSMAVDYEDDFGAGDTDSDSGGISNLADQSPAFKIKTRDVQFDGSDDEMDNLFRDDLVDLEVDNHADDGNEDDAF